MGSHMAVQSLLVMISLRALIAELVARPPSPPLNSFSDLDFVLLKYVKSNQTYTFPSYSIQYLFSSFISFFLFFIW